MLMVLEDMNFDLDASIQHNVQKKIIWLTIFIVENYGLNLKKVCIATGYYLYVKQI